jgi:hypothetical protein
MKFLATKKEMKNNYSKIIRIGYCHAQYLLNFESPIAYSAGRDGWACDYYLIDNVLISTGYQPIGNIVPDYDMITKYENQAMSIVHSNTTYDSRIDQVNAILHQFVKEVTQ